MVKKQQRQHSPYCYFEYIYHLSFALILLALNMQLLAACDKWQENRLFFGIIKLGLHNLHLIKVAKVYFKKVAKVFKITTIKLLCCLKNREISETLNSDSQLSKQFV